MKGLNATPRLSPPLPPPPPLPLPPDAGDKSNGIISDESFFNAQGWRLPGTRDGGNGMSLVVTHHAGRNGSAPDHRPHSAAAAGGPVAMAERLSGNGDPPGVNAVRDDNAGGRDPHKGGDSGSDDDADCLDNDSNGSIQEDDRGSDYETDLLS